MYCEINFSTGMNATLRLPKNEPPLLVMGLEGNFKLPNGNGEVHSFNTDLDYTLGFKNLNYSLKYRTAPDLNKYGIWVLVSYWVQFFVLLWLYIINEFQNVIITMLKI